MQSSQKIKSRKPIFGKKQKNEDSNIDKMYQTTPSLMQQSIPFSQTQSVQMNSTIVHPTWKPTINHSNSVAKITIPMNVRTYSPPRMVPQQNSNIFVNRPLTPQIQAIPVFRQTPNIQQQVVTTQFYQTQPQFYKGQGLSKVSSKCHPRFQNMNIPEKVVRSNELKPTVVAVERVMRQIGQNKLSAQNIFKSKQNTSFVQNIVQPERIQVYDQILRKNASQSQKIYKLAEINGILSRNYDVLLDQVQHLKRQQQVQEEFMDENMFIRKAANHFENLLSVEIHKALNQIQQVHKVDKRFASSYRKQQAHSFFR